MLWGDSSLATEAADGEKTLDTYFHSTLFASGEPPLTVVELLGSVNLSLETHSTRTSLATFGRMLTATRCIARRVCC